MSWRAVKIDRIILHIFSHLLGKTCSVHEQRSLSMWKQVWCKGCCHAIVKIHPSYVFFVFRHSFLWFGTNYFALPCHLWYSSTRGSYDISLLFHSHLFITFDNWEKNSETATINSERYTSLLLLDRENFINLQ